MKRLEKISVLTAKLKKAVAEEGIGGLAGRTKGYLEENYEDYKNVLAGKTLV